jgi:hypothetical protein
MASRTRKHTRSFEDRLAEKRIGAVWRQTNFLPATSEKLF